ncbi:DUF6191 domain-containing protein [Streptomyces sp. NRRL F-525]|uniref:DUF6191 domain-containing protein n=1 Tax=Streptomyces sp. NRRL F-525 TaxID=1463861 RepID=UPI000B29AE0C|nr:DUF6191 domain-containing protein [Streptomyces sp. NRRL F-525]
MFNMFEELFSPGRKHTQDEANRLELTRVDVADGDPGRGPIDLESGKVVVRLPEAEAEAEAEAGADSDPESDAGPGSESDPDSELDADADAGPESAPSSGAATSPESPESGRPPT